MQVSDRLKEMLRLKEWTPAELARRSGVPQPTVHRVITGASRNPRRETIDSLAKVLGCPPEHLWSGKASDTQSPAEREFYSEPGQIGRVTEWDDVASSEGDEVTIPFLREVELVAGHDGAHSAGSESRPALRFSKSTLRRHGVQAQEALCIVVRGNSMEPVLKDGSTVAVATTEKGVIDGKIYALLHDGLLRVKLLYRLPGGGIRLRSFNRDEHPDEEYTPSEMASQELSIIGRVFWFASFI